MKSKRQPLSYFSAYPVKSVEKETSSQSANRQSPYLKAILTGKIEQTGRIVKMALSDKLAAIRYIKESKWRNHLSRG
jgi:hypothetical protein